MASNPVFNRFNEDLAKGRYVGEQQPQYGQQGYGQSYLGVRQGGHLSQQGGYPVPDREKMHRVSVASLDAAGRLTLDDVIIKMLPLFGTLLVCAAIGWLVADGHPGEGTALWLGSLVVGLVVGLVISLKRIVSVPLILTYAVCEGLFVGAASSFFNSVYNGVVIEVVLTTLCVFAGMFVGWKIGLIKVTERSRKIFVLMVMGYLLFALVNVVLVRTGVFHNLFGVGGTGLLGIIISIFAVSLASYSIAVDFDTIQRCVDFGLPEKYSWLMAHGLLVSVVWLYIELLRLFARMRN